MSRRQSNINQCIASLVSFQIQTEDLYLNTDVSLVMELVGQNFVLQGASMMWYFYTRAA